MLTAARECPSCKATLAVDAVFCHRCGIATPQEIDRLTGEVRVPQASGVEDAARRQALQRALGNDCEVGRLLGRGGFAEVYVAYDKRLKREIAVKTIRGDLVVNETLLQRFQREAEAVAKLRHPNVVPIYSVGESNGIAYFTMPLIAGESLAAVLDREGRLSVRDSVRILRESCYALHAAHRVGIVHRDVKPENIMLEGPERSVVVMDFGIAKSTEPESKGLTGTGMVVGTPHYMSPEQAMGDSALDARSDQYALATIGYRMLTGRAPFEGEIKSLIFKIVTEIPARASQVAPDVPPVLSDVLARALAKRPDDRYESMAAFAEALAQIEPPMHGVARARMRRRLEMPARVRAAGESMPRWHVWSALGALTLAGTAVLLVASTPRAALDVAGARDDAQFAAKTFLSAHAPPGRRQEFATFATRDTTLRLLRQALGFAGLHARASSDVPVWEWNIRSLSREARDEWRVSIGAHNRVTNFRRPTPDTTPGATISRDSARALAEREVAGLGWTPAQLDRLPDSTIARKARTDHVFRWTVRGTAIPWRGKDSAIVQLRVVVAGDRVTRFGQYLQEPEAYVATLASANLGVGAIGGLLIIGLLVVVIAVVVRRQQVDQFQWKPMLRVVVVGGGLSVLTVFLPVAYEGLAAWRAIGDNPFGSALAATISFLIAGALVACLAVAGESLANERRPEVIAGLDDASRGRLIIPEIVPAAIYGYAFGGLISLARGAVVFTTLHFGVGRPKLPDFPFSRLTALSETAGVLSSAGAFALVLLFGVAFADRIPRLSRVSVMIPAATMALIGGMLNTTAPAAISATLFTALVSFTLWRFGLLAAFLATATSLAFDKSVQLFRVADGGFGLAALACALLFAAPAVLAFTAYRRFLRTDAPDDKLTDSHQSPGAAARAG